MIKLKQYALFAAFTVLGLGVITFAFKTQSARIKQQQAVIAAKEQQITQLQNNLQTVNIALKQSETAAKNLQNDYYQLSQQQHTLTQHINQQKQTIKRLSYENTHIKSWLDTPVPDDIIRVLNPEPATTGDTDDQN